MAPQNEHIDDQLLAYHMGMLNRSEMEALDRLIESLPEVAARSRAISDAIEPLADWSALPTVENLEKHVLSHIERQTDFAVVPLTESIKFDPVPRQRARVFSFPFSLRDLLTAAACLVILAGVLVPGLARASAYAQRNRCADNLRHIASALFAYANDYDEYLPFTDPARDGDELFSGDRAPANWLRERTPGVQRLHNSRNRFLLVSHDYVSDTAVFVCPADRQAVVMRYDDVSAFGDFAERRNCSYDSQIMFDSQQRATHHPQLVIYSDANPIFDTGHLRHEDSDPLNSLLHRGLSGQNVMRLEGGVTWATSPNVGVQNDNIWQIGQRLNYTGSEMPQLATDSFLIP